MGLFATCGVLVRKDPVSVHKPTHSLDDSTICVYKVVRLGPRNLISESDNDHELMIKFNDLFLWKYLVLILSEIYHNMVTL